ncbi:MAG TPA: carbohydrate porin [Steroidobacteraceae bacterium]|nr:carbohydrate porin [Steroidobacteraceae bacterium]
MKWTCLRIALWVCALAPPGARAAAPPTPAGAATAATAAAAAAAAPGSQAAAPPASLTTASETDLVGPDSFYPGVLAAQYTFILQHQSALYSPYAGPLSLKPGGDTQPTNTLGIYTGWAPLTWGQLYLDVEKFMGEGVSDATGLAGLTNDDVIRAGPSQLRKTFYIARLYARFMWPLGGGAVRVERSQDQIAGAEAARRLELKVGHLAAPDDFDQNRYAGSPRTQFLNGSLVNDGAWDYARDTRGYTDGIVVGYVSPAWSLNYGVYRMPTVADGEQLVTSLARANGQNLQLSLTGLPTGTVVRLLGYLNTAAMGDYAAALVRAAATHALPDVAASALPGRQKHGFGFDAEQPLADDGDTGMFLRWGWNDGREQSFTFTEVDEVVSTGVQISGDEWRQPDAQLGFGVASEAISGPHRAYLAAGGCGFVLCDGRLNYGREQILEAYYRLLRIWPEDPGPVRWELGPDFQFIRNPGYNRDRGPVSFWGVRLHVDY